MASRAGKKVADITAASDQRTLLRFLGWVSSIQSGPAGSLDCAIFARAGIQNVVEQWVLWCSRDRGLSYGTIGCVSLPPPLFPPAMPSELMHDLQDLPQFIDQLRVLRPQQQSL